MMKSTAKEIQCNVRVTGYVWIKMIYSTQLTWKISWIKSWLNPVDLVYGCLHLHEIPSCKVCRCSKTLPEWRQWRPLWNISMHQFSNLPLFLSTWILRCRLRVHILSVKYEKKYFTWIHWWWVKMVGKKIWVTWYGLCLSNHLMPKTCVSCY